MRRPRGYVDLQRHRSWRRALSGWPCPYNLGCDILVLEVFRFGLAQHMTCVFVSARHSCLTLRLVAPWRWLPALSLSDCSVRALLPRSFKVAVCTALDGAVASLPEVLVPFNALAWRLFVRCFPGHRYMSFALVPTKVSSLRCDSSTRTGFFRPLRASPSVLAGLVPSLRHSWGSPLQRFVRVSEPDAFRLALSFVPLAIGVVDVVASTNAPDLLSHVALNQGRAFPPTRCLFRYPLVGRLATATWRHREVSQLPVSLACFSPRKTTNRPGFGLPMDRSYIAYV